MSGLPHLDGRQHVQHACEPLHPAPFAHANNHLVSSKPSSSLKQHSSHISSSRGSNSPSSLIPARATTEPASGHTTRGLTSQAFSPTSSIDTVSPSQGEPPNTEYQAKQTRSLSSRALMRPNFTQLAIGEIGDRRQAESKHSVSGVHNNGSTPVPEPLRLSAMAAGHKRTATGFIKPSVEDHPYSSSVNGTERRRSKSIGSTAHGNRIAAVIILCKSSSLRHSLANINLVVRAPSHASIICGGQSRAKPTIPCFPENITIALASRRPFTFDFYCRPSPTDQA
jgi:hypothetical protein